MFCSNCGKQIDDTSVFCPNCGNKQSSVNSVKPNESNQLSVPLMGKLEIQYDIPKHQPYYIFIDNRMFTADKKGSGIINATVTPEAHLIVASQTKTSQLSLSDIGKLDFSGFGGFGELLGGCIKVAGKITDKINGDKTPENMIAVLVDEGETVRIKVTVKASPFLPVKYIPVKYIVEEIE